ncbi:hypothetical protein SRABI128_01237 [Microbacterium sp. Bi128]|nr:hypothetical protein SRABI128_01237 [Microbacterium sp. Bi128]
MYVGYCTNTISLNGTSLTAIAICTSVRGFVSDVDGSTLRSAVEASLYSVAGFDSTSSLLSFVARRDMYCCWFEMRPRSPPSPTPCRVRRNWSASRPLMVRMPAGQSMPV